MADDQNTTILSDLGDEEDRVKVQPARSARSARPAQTAAVGLPATVRIVLEETDNMPPTGYPLGFNGRTFIIRPNEPVDVPQGVVDILDHAVMSVPVKDPQTQKVVGYRDRLRVPYRRV